MNYKMQYIHDGSGMKLVCTLDSGGVWVSSGMGEHFEMYVVQLRYRKGIFEYRDDRDERFGCKWQLIPDLREMTEEDFFQLSTVMELPMEIDFILKLQKKIGELNFNNCPRSIDI